MRVPMTNSSYSTKSAQRSHWIVIHAVVVPAQPKINEFTTAPVQAAGGYLWAGLRRSATLYG